MKVAIVGCTHAGTLAAKQIMLADPSSEVVVFERNDNISFLSCGISLYIEGTVRHLEDMFYASPEELKQLGVDVRMRHNVLSVDAAKHSLRALNIETGETCTVQYDKLIMATGSRALVPPVTGVHSSRILLCKDYAQAKEIRSRIEGAQRVAIVGGGYVGVEMAESLSWIGKNVQLFQGNDQLLNHYVGHEMSAQIATIMAEQGIDVRLSHRVLGFHEREDDVVVQTAQGEFSADVVLVTTGFMPVTELLKQQVAMTDNGAIVINEYCQSSDPDIYAAGDCATSYFNPTASNIYAPLATNAIRQGMIAGNNVLGNEMPYLGTQATSAMRLFDYTLASTGLTLEYAERNGINAHQVTYRGTWRPEYMPTTDPLDITLVYDVTTREILGAQLISKHEIAQSANTIAVAIQNGNTIDDLAFMDMLFQPHYDFPFNYLNLVAQLAVERERKDGRQAHFTAFGKR